MPRSLWEVLLSFFREERDENGDDEEPDEQFVPSPLDLSVRFAHGGPDNEVKRELNKIEEQAQQLEQSQRDE